MGYGWSHFVSIVLVKWSVYKVITCRRVSSLHHEWVAPAVGSWWHDCDWTRHRESRSKQSLVFWPPAQCRAGPHTHTHAHTHTHTHIPYCIQRSMYTHMCTQSSTTTETLPFHSHTCTLTLGVTHLCTLPHKFSLYLSWHIHTYTADTLMHSVAVDCWFGWVSCKSGRTLPCFCKAHDI